MDISVTKGVVAPQDRTNTTAFARPPGLGCAETNSLSQGDMHPEFAINAAPADNIKAGLNRVGPPLLL
jgi:hypothetical protein